MTAVLAFNFGPEYIRRLHKTATKESPGKFTKSFISKSLRAKEVRSKTKKKLNFKPSTKMYAFQKLYSNYYFFYCKTNLYFILELGVKISV